MARATLVPVSLRGAAGLALPSVAASAQLPAIGPTWSGVQFVNSGSLWLVVYNGTGSNFIQQNIGGQVQGIAPTVAPLALTASTNYIFGNWSAKDYTQLDGSGMMYVDFTGTIANIGVSLYQVTPIP